MTVKVSDHPGAIVGAIVTVRMVDADGSETGNIEHAVLESPQGGGVWIARHIPDDPNWGEDGPNGVEKYFGATSADNDAVRASYASSV